MSLTVGVMSLLVERLWTVLPVSPYFDSLSALTLTGGLMLCGGLIAFLMVWVEFTVISETSALTFMVAGTFKEIVTGAANCTSRLDAVTSAWRASDSTANSTGGPPALY